RPRRAAPGLRTVGWRAGCRCPDGPAGGCGPSAGTHPVADTAHGADVAGTGCVVAELVPQIADVHVDDVVVAVPFAAPDAVQQLAAGEDHVRFGAEGVEQVELGPRQLDGHAVEADLPAYGVDGERADPPSVHRRLGRPGAGAAQHRPDPGDELVRAERLGELVVRADR